MKGIKFLVLSLFLLLSGGGLPLRAQHADLEEKIVNTIATEAATSIETGKWYLMYTRGRQGYAYEDDAKNMKTRSNAPATRTMAISPSVYQSLVRFVDSGTAGQYYLQTGSGHYFGSLINGIGNKGGGNINTNTESPETYYTINTIGDNSGHFYLNDQNGVILDANSVGYSLAGWGTNAVTSPNGNNDWAFYEVTFTDASQLKGTEWLNYKLTKGNLFRLSNKAYGRVATDSNGEMIPATRDESDYSQIWIIEAAGSGYTLRNAHTGKYIQHQSTVYQKYRTNFANTTLYIKASPTNSAESDNYFTISNNENASGISCLHDDRYGKIVPWKADAAASAWEIEPVTDKTIEDVKARLYPALADGKYYHIFNNNYRFPLTEEENGILKCQNFEENNYAQIWKLVADGDKFKLQNVRSGRYIQKQNGTLSQLYQTGEDGDVSFTFAESTLPKGMACATAYAIGDGTKNNRPVGLHCGGPTNYDVVGWYTDDNLGSTWVLHEVEMSQDELNRANFLQDYPDGGLFRISNRLLRSFAEGTKTLITEDSDNILRIANEKSGDEAYAQIWLMEPSGSGYTFRNTHTGRYIHNDPENNPSSATAATFYVKYSANNGTSNPKEYITISSTEDFSGKNALHFKDNNRLVKGNAGKGDADQASDWRIEAVEDFTAEQIKMHMSAALGHHKAQAGSYYRIVNNNYNAAIFENLSTKEANCRAVNETEYAQLWTLEQDGNGNFAIKNAVTGNYIQPQTGNGLSAVYKTGETAGYFSFNDTDEEWIYNYAIADIVKNANGNNGLHCDASFKVVCWYTAGSAPSIWRLQKEEVDEAALQNARDEYQASQDITANTETYDNILQTIFNDYACTELKEEYKNGGETLETAMAGLPETIKKMVRKVQGNTWTVYADWDKGEKTYRVASYKPYSDYSKWSHEIIKTSYSFGRLSNPTGITAKAGEPVTIYVGGDIPEGTQLAIEGVSESASSGSLVTLKKGLNSVVFSQDANLFVFYNVTDTEKRLADLPEIKIHIEGGQVNGYFDLTKGYTNEDWAKLQTHLLGASSVLNLKTRHLVFCMPAARVKAACPEKMVELLGVWDNIVSLQHGLMGLDEYTDRFNCILTACSPGSNYMHAAGHGTYYAEGTLGDIMNYERMSTGGTIWGPAHENGHIHQRLINMVGCTEISNNIFSNVAVHEQGYLTSRTDAPATTLGRFNEGKFWLDHGTWGCTRLYWQLYLYYHVQGHNPEFFPRLFKALRQDPLNHASNVAIPANEDYLKFALKCCQVAGEDLSEFFEGYGFFVIPSDMTTEKNGHLCKQVGDYATYYLYVDQAMIDQAKADMKACGKPNGNIIFIDDRIKPVMAKDGGEKKKFDNGGAIDFANHEYGEMGQYTDFTDENNCNGIKYTVTDRTVTVEGNGAVGIKVYDTDGRLLYLSNNSSFTLPASVDPASIIVKAAAGNGEDVIAPNAADNPFALDIYKGSKESKRTFYVTGNGDVPAWTGNSMAVVEETAALPEALTDKPNLIQKQADGTYKAARFVLTDKLDFYAPCDFTAGQASYTRAATGKYNSLCLPFPVSSADFGEGCKIYSLTDLDQDGNGAYTIRFTDKETAEAGEPCLVLCPSEVSSLNILKENVTVVCTPKAGGVAAANDANLVMQGSFTNHVIGEKKYKLSNDGTRFGITTPAGKVTAFRAYIEDNVPVQRARSFNTAFEDRPATGIEEAPAASVAPEAVYDLQGRRVVRPVKGGIYIVNGKKLIVK